MNTTQCRAKKNTHGGKERKGSGVLLTYSRTADAESVVLNFAKVLTYSRVLLYTLLREGRGEREQAKKDMSRIEQHREGRHGGVR
jgi:hypothetical protein